MDPFSVPVWSTPFSPNALCFYSLSELKTNLQAEEDDSTHDTDAAHDKEPGQNPSDENQVPEEQNSKMQQRNHRHRSRKRTTNTENDKTVKRPKNGEELDENEGNTILRHLSFEMNVIKKEHLKGREI